MEDIKTGDNLLGTHKYDGRSLCLLFNLNRM